MNICMKQFINLAQKDEESIESKLKGETDVSDMHRGDSAK